MNIDPLVEIGKLPAVEQRRNPNRKLAKARYQAKRMRKGTIRTMKRELGRRLTDSEMMGLR